MEKIPNDWSIGLHYDDWNIPHSLAISKSYQREFKFKYYSTEERDPICNYLKYANQNRKLLCNSQSPGIYFNCAKESTIRIDK